MYCETVTSSWRIAIFNIEGKIPAPYNTYHDRFPMASGEYSALDWRRIASELTARLFEAAGKQRRYHL